MLAIEVVGYLGALRSKKGKFSFSSPAIIHQLLQSSRDEPTKTINGSLFSLALKDQVLRGGQLLLYKQSTTAQSPGLRTGHKS